jgi:predicted phosphodiesterase
MKVLCTSDWHMGIYGDPSDALKLNNSQTVDLLTRWDEDYDLIILNGDLLETLKSSRIKFSHSDQAKRVLDDRLPVIEKILTLKNYHWLVGNHDYSLEKILNLPRSMSVSLDNDYTLLAEHGHLLRAPIEHYSNYAWHFHLMYCLSWWIDKIGMKLADDQFCFESKIAQSLNSFRSKSSEKTLSDKFKKFFIRLGDSYASLNSDNSYHSLEDIFVDHAIKLFKNSKTIVTFGHSHQRKIKYFDNNNIYVNTGFFSHHTNYSTFVFSTDDGLVKIIKNI